MKTRLNYLYIVYGICVTLIALVGSTQGVKGWAFWYVLISGIVITLSGVVLTVSDRNGK